MTYVTRLPYHSSRRGTAAARVAGKPYPGIVDATNIPNDWQGALRFGWLDLDVLDVIAKDLAEAKRLSSLSTKLWLSVTCLDHVGDEKVTYSALECKKEIACKNL